MRRFHFVICIIICLFALSDIHVVALEQATGSVGITFHKAESKQPERVDSSAARDWQEITPPQSYPVAEWDDFSPYTGDRSHVMAWLALFLSALIIAIILIMKKKGDSQ